MRKWTWALLLAAALPISACSVEKEEEGELPEVEVEGGKLPEYDVDPAKVEVNKDTTKVVTPDIDIKTKKDTTTRD